MLKLPRTLRDSDKSSIWEAVSQLSTLNGSNRTYIMLYSFFKDLIDNKKCTGLEDQVENRLKKITEQWEFLVQKSTEKNLKLKEASKQQTFNAAIKDIEFWLSLINTQLSHNNQDYGKDLASVQNLQKKHQLIQADIQAHEDQIKELNQTAQQFTTQPQTASLLSQINERYDNIKDVALKRQSLLQDAYQLHQYIRDIDDEDAWIKEKILLIQNDDYGKDLNSVQNLKKKHKRFENELNTHELIIKQLLEISSKHDTNSLVNEKIEILRANWLKLKQLNDERNLKLNDALKYQLWLAMIDEERSWIKEKEHFLNQSQINQQQLDSSSLAQIKNLLKKHDAFETDLNVHKQRINENINENGAVKLLDENNFNRDLIHENLSKLNDDLNALNDLAKEKKKNLNEIKLYLEYLWKCDVVESWVNEKQKQIQQDSANAAGHNLASILNLLSKHDTFEAGLNAFETEGIFKINELKDKLIESLNLNNEPSEDKYRLIQNKYDHVMTSWLKLRQASNARFKNLLEMKEKYKQIDDLYLKFAKNSSSFNSWFENAEEDLTDPVRCNSLVEINELRCAHERFFETLNVAKKEFEQLQELDLQIRNLVMSSTNKTHSPIKIHHSNYNNPYTWFTMDTLKDTWRSLEKAIKDRENDLMVEMKRQEEADVLRKQYANEANQFYVWLTQTRNDMIECSVHGTLEAQLEATKGISKQVKDNRKYLEKIEVLSSKLEEKVILDNIYTEHSTLSLAQAYDQLDQFGMRMQHNLEQQIQARNQSGVSEESLREFSMMFKHFDKEKLGKLNHDEFKSCLRALGYDLPMVEQNQADQAFEAILDQVDPNRDGYVNLQEFMAFMISRETENISSVADVINAFKALTENSERSYITKEELAAVSFLFV
jgi:spectrin alpha